MSKKVWFVIGLVSALVLALAFYGLQGGLLTGVQAQPKTPAAAVKESVDTSRTITVVGEGKVSIKPDRAEALIGVETMGSTVREATQKSTRIMEAILVALHEQGVTDKDIQTSGFSVWTDRGGPIPEKVDGEPEEQIIYRVNNTVRVTVNDLDKLSAILDAVIEAGANAIYGISFSIADPSQLETQVRIKAIADAKAKAQELADLAGVRLGPVVSVSEIVGGGILPMTTREMAGMGGGVGPVSPGEMDFTMQLQVVYAIE